LTSDVTVKVIDSTLELYDTVDVTARREVKGQRSIINEGRYRGTIDLPNYIDSGRVQFDIVAKTDGRIGLDLGGFRLCYIRKFGYRATLRKRSRPTSYDPVSVHVCRSVFHKPVLY